MLWGKPSGKSDFIHFCLYLLNMAIENLAETLLEKLRWISQAETVVGKPIESGGTTIIPVSRVSLGFGIGGHAGKGELTASGGGAQVDPVAFLVIRGDDVQVLPVQKGSSLLTKIYDLVPDVVAGVASHALKKDKPGDKV